MASSGCVVVTCGSQIHSETRNLNFVFRADPFMLDDATKKPLSLDQKPVALFSELIKIYTVSAEWVLSAFSDLGKHLHH